MSSGVTLFDENKRARTRPKNPLAASTVEEAIEDLRSMLLFRSEAPRAMDCALRSLSCSIMAWFSRSSLRIAALVSEKPVMMMATKRLKSMKLPMTMSPTKYAPDSVPDPRIAGYMTSPMSEAVSSWNTVRHAKKNESNPTRGARPTIIVWFNAPAISSNSEGFLSSATATCSISRLIQCSSSYGSGLDKLTDSTRAVWSCASLGTRIRT
mmetsp:Transcript_56586/g.132531  ORF Transcript_56586/g.132531 Transcript_56586/m.132531 type:complete len:210 (+) Transcript_56586:2312-2941(+)